MYEVSILFQFDSVWTVVAPKAPLSISHYVRLCNRSSDLSKYSGLDRPLIRNFAASRDSKEKGSFDVLDSIDDK